MQRELLSNSLSNRELRNLFKRVTSSKTDWELGEDNFSTYGNYLDARNPGCNHMLYDF